jgi:diguanylate cyclase (GGDEF)-like protein
MEILGYDTEPGALPHLSAIERILYPEDISAFAQHLRILSTKTTDEVEVVTLRFRSSDGTYRWLLFRDGVFDRNSDGSPRTVLCTAQDLTQQKLAERDLVDKMRELDRARIELEEKQGDLVTLNHRLEELALTDGVTGLKNHRAFQERIAEEVHRALRYNQKLALLLADLDRFKAYNDTYGHPEGDRALKGFGAVLTEVSRTSDTAVRYGGEEFAIILPNTGAEEAAFLAERIRVSLKGTYFGIRGVTASFGCSEVSPGPDAKERLVAAADRALYQSKADGRDRVTVHHPGS